MNLGLIGAGTIAAAIVEGLQSSSSNCSILLSPRNAETSFRLAAQFANVRVASDNQAMLDGSDTVVLAIRPQIADEVLSALNFRPNHRVISLIPGVTLESLRALTAPAASVARAVPLPWASRRQSPTVVFPPDAATQALFDELGTCIVLDREEEFEAFTTATSIMSSYFGFAGTVTAWMQREGVAATKAHAFVTQMLRGLAAASAASPESSFAELVEAHQTPGGLNEQLHRSLTDSGAFEAMDQALDGVRDRLIAGQRNRLEIQSHLRGERG